MKNQIFFAVLSVVAVFASGAEFEQEIVAGRVHVVDLEVEDLPGGGGPGWAFVTSRFYNKAPIADAVQSQEITYRGDSNTRISHIQVTEYGHTQGATADIIAGGVNMNTVTIRLTSARGYGYSFKVAISGR